MDHTQTLYKTVQLDFPSFLNSMFPRPTHSPTIHLLDEQGKNGIRITYDIDPDATPSFIPKDNTRMCTRPLDISALRLNEDLAWEIQPITSDEEMYFMLDQSHRSLHAVNSNKYDELARLGFRLTAQENQNEHTLRAQRGLNHVQFVLHEYSEGLRDVEKRLEYARAAAERTLEGIVGMDDAPRKPRITNGYIAIAPESSNFPLREGKLLGWRR